VLQLAGLSGTNEEVLTQLEQLVAGSAQGGEGVGTLREVLDAARAAGVPDERLQLDPSIARGLDYYTGTIYETFLDQLTTIGSVCSGGRYDNLAALFTRQELPGIGASLGLDRLLAAMEELGMIEPTSTPAPVFIPYFDRDRLHDYLSLAGLVRSAGIGVELFPEPKRLGQQLKYADRRGFVVALIVGRDEFEAGTCQVKDLRRQSSEEVQLTDDGAALLDAVRRACAES